MTKKKKIGIAVLILLIFTLACAGIFLMMKLMTAQKYGRQISLGDKYLNALDYENAEICYRNALNIDDKKAAAYLNLSVLYQKQGKDEEAVEILEQALAVKAITKDEATEKLLRRRYQELLQPLGTSASGERDIVLLLDTSGSMDGEPMEETKKASSQFIKTVLSQGAAIGMVPYASEAEILAEFSTNQLTLEQAVEKLQAVGGTDLGAGLETAYDMLRESKAKKKIIVLMSDGESNEGMSREELLTYADNIKKNDVYIYTLGFFSSLGEGEKAQAQAFLGSIASEGCHYEVENAKDLVFFFDDIADQINGQPYVYVRIACPVDVTVTSEGETLTSKEGNFSTRTSFGTLSFEEAAESEEESSSIKISDILGFSGESQENEEIDDRIKILRLKDNVIYNLKLEGNGNGRMDYTIGFMGEDGEYNDFREFKNIKITPDTKIDTQTKSSGNTLLKVDENGDGKYDMKYRAGANEKGEVVDYTFVIYLSVGAAGVVICAGAMIFICYRRKKNKFSSR